MMPEGLLKSKLFSPPPRPNQVTRKSLLEKFTQAHSRGVRSVLVSAPAGFGKTTLVGDCARASGTPFAWLALDEGDNDLLRFWRYMDAALATIDSRIGEGLRPALYAAQAPAIQQIITGLVNDIISIDKALILVLDDYHLIELPAIHDSLNYLLDHLPPQMTLVVITRSDPPLNLARRRGHGQMIELRANDLRFSADETAAFLNQSMQLGLTSADIASLSQRTEGWIAGLQMAALALQSTSSLQDELNPHDFIAAFSGDDHHIADYLVEEVLQRQPVEVQNFLLQTSILSRLSAPLCNAVTARSDSAALLNALERANLFLLPLDNRREWFRYHHLFADLLRQRLRDNFSEGAIASLHRAAAQWYESQGDVSNAVHHARTVQDYHAILRLLEQHAGRLFAAGELPQLFELANLLPADLRSTSPRLCTLVAWAALATNRYGDVPAWLSSVEAHFGLPAECVLSDPTLDIPLRAALLEVLVIRLQLPFSRSPEEQRAQTLAARDQINALPPGQVCLINPAANLRPVVNFNLGQQAEEMGDLELAAQTLAETVVSARETNNSNLFYLASAHLAGVQVARGQLRAASKTYTQTLEVPPFAGQPISPFMALAQVGLGAIQFEWNNLEAAERCFRDALFPARLWNLWEALLPLTLGQARLKQRAGDTAAALDLLNRLDPHPVPGRDMALRAYAALLGGPRTAAAWLALHPQESNREPDPSNELLLLTIARLLACTGRVEEAVSQLEKLSQFAEADGRIHLLIQAKTALAVLARRSDMLIDALALAEPETYLATFLLEGEPLADLLQYALRQPDQDPRIQAYGQRILLAFEDASRQTAPASTQINSPLLPEPLTERELEVLRYIAEGLSNPEIASRLYLSPNTLKAHTQNIFTKLDVHNRLQAVNKAKELGLIPKG